MSYWGSTYMPMIDELVDNFARSWVEQVGKDCNHNWPSYRGSDCDDESVLEFIRLSIDDSRDEFCDFSSGGYGEYEKYLFEGLRDGIEIVLEGDM